MRSFVLDVLQGLAEEAVDVFIVQRIEDVATFFGETDESHLPQGAQLVRDGRMAHAERLCQCVNAQFVIGECSDDAHARGIAERLEGAR